MISINPLLPFFPDSISFLIYGLVTGLLLKFWRIAKRNIFVILFFLYAYAVWLASMALLMSVQSQTQQAWFLFGFALTFIKIFSIIRTIFFTPFVFAFETITERVQEHRADRRDHQRQQQRERESQNYDRDQDIRAEQARREAEARANRARQSGNRQDDRQGDNEKIENNNQRKRNNPPEAKHTERKRSYEEVLGLKNGWTQDDLKKSYQREANRTHPDKWIGKPQAIQDMMEAEYKAVQEAYRRLKR
jgi:E3 ubiquitin-protein ligase DOA10